MIKAYNFRAYPNTEQQLLFVKTFLLTKVAASG